MLGVGSFRVFLGHACELRQFPAGRSFVAAAEEEEEVRRAGEAVTNMAYFPARYDKPSDYWRAGCVMCDLYVGLIELRYSSPVRNRTEVSYAELELEAATEVGVPWPVFLLDEHAAPPVLEAPPLDSMGLKSATDYEPG